MHEYFVYAISVDGIVRYIGKGKGERHLSHLRLAGRIAEGFPPRRSRMSLVHMRLADAVANDVEIVVSTVVENLSEPDAFGIEVALIRALGREGLEPSGLLWNRSTDSRGGRSAAIREAMKDPRVLEKVRAPRGGFVLSAAARDARKGSRRGKSSPALKAILECRNKSDVQREAIRAAMAGKPKSHEHRLKMSLAARDASRSDEGRAARVKNLGNVWSDPVKREEMLAKRRTPEYRAQRSLLSRAAAERRKQRKEIG